MDICKSIKRFDSLRNIYVPEIWYKSNSKCHCKDSGSSLFSFHFFNESQSVECILPLNWNECGIWLWLRLLFSMKLAYDMMWVIHSFHVDTHSGVTENKKLNKTHVTVQCVTTTFPNTWHILDLFDGIFVRYCIHLRDEPTSFSYHHHHHCRIMRKGYVRFAAHVHSLCHFRGWSPPTVLLFLWRLQGKSIYWEQRDRGTSGLCTMCQRHLQDTHQINGILNTNDVFIWTTHSHTARITKNHDSIFFHYQLIIAIWISGTFAIQSTTDFNIYPGKYKVQHIQFRNDFTKTW